MKTVTELKACVPVVENLHDHIQEDFYGKDTRSKFQELMQTLKHFLNQVMHCLEVRKL